MVTKAKTTPSQKPGEESVITPLESPSGSLESKAAKGQTAGSSSNIPPAALSEGLSKALDLLHTDKVQEAEKAFTALLSQAETAGHLGILRTVRNALSAIRSRTVQPDKHLDHPELQASFHLNRHEVPAAVAILENLLSTSQSAQACYLMALAQVLEDQLEQGAEWLKKAVDADSSFLNLYRMETDFEEARSSPAFAVFERE